MISNDYVITSIPNPIGMGALCCCNDKWDITGTKILGQHYYSLKHIPLRDDLCAFSSVWKLSSISR